MSLRLPIKFSRKEFSPKGFPVRSTQLIPPRTYRSPAASRRRQYGPFVTAVKMMVKGLFLGLVGLTLCIVLFAVFQQESSVILLGKIWTESWKPIVVLVLTLAVLAAIEESFT